MSIEFFGSDLMVSCRGHEVEIPDERLPYMVHRRVLEDADPAGKRAYGADYVHCPDTGVETCRAISCPARRPVALARMTNGHTAAWFWPTSALWYARRSEVSGLSRGAPTPNHGRRLLGYGSRPAGAHAHLKRCSFGGWRGMDRPGPCSACSST